MWLILRVTGSWCVFLVACWSELCSSDCPRSACRRQPTGSMRIQYVKFRFLIAELICSPSLSRTCQWTATAQIPSSSSTTSSHFMNRFTASILNFYKYKGQILGSGPLKVTLKVTHLATWQRPGATWFDDTRAAGSFWSESRVRVHEQTNACAPPWVACEGGHMEDEEHHRDSYNLVIGSQSEQRPFTMLC